MQIQGAHYLQCKHIQDLSLNKSSRHQLTAGDLMMDWCGCIISHSVLVTIITKNGTNNLYSKIFHFKCFKLILAEELLIFNVDSRKLCTIRIDIAPEQKIKISWQYTRCHLFNTLFRIIPVYERYVENCMISVP